MYYSAAKKRSHPFGTATPDSVSAPVSRTHLIRPIRLMLADQCRSQPASKGSAATRPSKLAQVLVTLDSGAGGGGNGEGSVPAWTGTAPGGPEREQRGGSLAMGRQRGWVGGGWWGEAARTMGAVRGLQTHLVSQG